MTNEERRELARVAFKAYAAMPGVDTGDDVTTLGDLFSDSLHLLSELRTEDGAQVTPGYLCERALMHYYEEAERDDRWDDITCEIKDDDIVSESNDEVETLACAGCGRAADIVAWYPEHTSQSIKVERNADGELVYDYTGLTDSADDSGEDDGYGCRFCGAYVETLEELLGLPVPPAPYKLEVFSSTGAVAIQRANGQDILHLTRTDWETANDPLAEEGWVEMSNEEHQKIIDAVAEAIKKLR